MNSVQIQQNKKQSRMILLHPYSYWIMLQFNGIKNSQQDIPSFPSKFNNKGLTFLSNTSFILKQSLSLLSMLEDTTFASN